MAPTTGLEPVAGGLTVRCSNQLSYMGIEVERPGLEPGTLGLKGPCSAIEPAFHDGIVSTHVRVPTIFFRKMRDEGIEPPTPNGTGFTVRCKLPTLANLSHQ